MLAQVIFDAGTYLCTTLQAYTIALSVHLTSLILTYTQKMSLHRKKKVREFPVPSRDVTTKLSLGGNNDVITELFLPRGSLVSDIPAGDGKHVNLFLRCVSWLNIKSRSIFSVFFTFVMFLGFKLSRAFS
jgi:hypothetical protein